MKYFLVGIALFGTIGLTGCRTTHEILIDHERNVSAGAYQKSCGEVSEKAKEDSNTQLMWLLLAGKAHYLAGNLEESINYFDRAEDGFEHLDAGSVLKRGADTGSALLLNDRVLPYDGGGQDRIFTCFYKAVDYAVLGKISAVRTELNRAAQHQENWLYERRRERAASQEKLERAAAAEERKQKLTHQNRNQQVSSVLADATFAQGLREKCGYDPTYSGDLSLLSTSDYMNLYVQHVCGIFRWLAGDGGIAFLRDASQLRPEHPTLLRDYREAHAQQMPKDQVWIYVEDGLCPAREEWRVDLPTYVIPYLNRYVLYAGMALPYLRYRPAGAASYEVSMNGRIYSMPELTNVDRLLKVEYDVYMRGALTREITRALIRIGSQVALGIAADNTDNDSHELSLQLSQIGVAAYAASTTAADLRSWTNLPKAVYMLRVTRPPNGVIELLIDHRPTPIKVPPGNTMVWIRKPAVAAPPVVKQLTFPNPR